MTALNEYLEFPPVVATKAQNAWRTPRRLFHITRLTLLSSSWVTCHYSGRALTASTRRARSPITPGIPRRHLSVLNKSLQELQSSLKATRGQGHKTPRSNLDLMARINPSLGKRTSPPSSGIIARSLGAYLPHTTPMSVEVEKRQNPKEECNTFFVQCMVLGILCTDHQQAYCKSTEAQCGILSFLDTYSIVQLSGITTTCNT